MAAGGIDDFSIEENRNQLAIHEQQFVSRTAFVYTVLRPDESKSLLGCVYICPNESKDFDAIVTYWIRETETVATPTGTCQCFKSLVEERMAV